MTLTLKGGPELLATLDLFPNNVQRNVLRGALRAGAKIIRDEVKSTIPVRKGRLRRSITYGSQVRDGGPIGYVRLRGYVAYIGHFIEFGVSPHLIKSRATKTGERSVVAPAGHTVRYIGKVRTNARSLKIGRKFVGPVIHHPGFASKPFMRPALDHKAKEAIVAMGEYMAHRIQYGDIKAPRLDVDEAE